MTAQAEKKDLARQYEGLATWAAEGQIEFTLTSLTILDPDLAFEDYEELGSILGAFNRSSRWWIGDWILFGEKSLSESYEQAMQATGLNEGTLMNYVSVCRRVPRSRRRIEVPFSVHAEVASLTPGEQKHWLAIAAKEGLRQRDLRQRLREVNAAENGNGAVEVLPAAPKTRHVVDDIHAIARSIVKQARGDGKGHYLVPGELFIRLANLLGEEGA